MQSRRWSAIESATGVVVGCGINFAANLVVLPWFGFHPSVGDALGIGLVFTAIALVRNYAIRRFFNRRQL